MELICRSCGKIFPNTGNKKWGKYCPDCQRQIYLLRCRNRDSAQRAARRRHAILNPGPAHDLDLNTLLRELDEFNALRRAEGRSSISYGRYVAMRDKYIQTGDTAAVRQDARRGRSKIIAIPAAEAEGM